VFVCLSFFQLGSKGGGAGVMPPSQRSGPPLPTPNEIFCKCIWTNGMKKFLCQKLHICTYNRPNFSGGQPPFRDPWSPNYLLPSQLQVLEPPLPSVFVGPEPFQNESVVVYLYLYGQSCSGGLVSKAVRTFYIFASESKKKRATFYVYSSCCVRFLER